MFYIRKMQNSSVERDEKSMSDQILEVQGLCKKYRGFEIQNVSFCLEAGYIMGLIGRNGAGKTTLMKLIQNIVRRNAGTVTINGYDNVKDEVAAKNEIGFIMEHPFFDRMSLEENARMFGRFYERYDHETVLSYLQRFQLDPNKEYGKLSKGMQTKFQLSFALSHQAKLLIMDEPTGGLDPIFRREFLSLLQEVADTERVGIIISTHITSDLDKIADYIALIDAGELIFYKTKEELMDEYWLVKGSRDLLKKIPDAEFISIRKYNQGFEALTCNKRKCMEYCSDTDQILFERASIDDIMYYINKGRSETI